MQKKIDWNKAKQTYITSSISQRDLAEKLGVSHTIVARHAKLEKWQQERDKFVAKVSTNVIQKTIEKVSENESNKLAKTIDMLNMLSDQMQTMLKDDKQFKKREVTIGGKIKTVVVDKYNTKEIKEATEILKNLTELTRNLYNLPLNSSDEKQDVEVRMSIPDDYSN